MHNIAPSLIHLGNKIRTKIRPCEKALGLAIANANEPKKGILLCNKPRPGEIINALDYDSNGIETQDYLFSTLNRIATSQEMTVDRLTAFISSELMHEMIHLGDSNQCK